MRHILFALTALAAPSFAQNTTSNCYRIGNQINCNSQQQPMVGGTNLAPVDFGAALRPTPNPYAEQQAAIAAQQAQQLRQQQIEMQRLEIERRKSEQALLSTTPQQHAYAFNKDEKATVAAALIGKGRCLEAIAFLRREGDEDMAANAAKVCLMTSPPK